MNIRKSRRESKVDDEPATRVLLWHLNVALGPASSHDSVHEDVCESASLRVWRRVGLHASEAAYRHHTARLFDYKLCKCMSGTTTHHLLQFLRKNSLCPFGAHEGPNAVSHFH